MALLIKKDVSVVGGISVPQLYVRIFLTVDYNGKNIYVNTETYISKEAYLNNSSNNEIKVLGIPDSKVFPYDRNKDGVDVLLVAHNKMKDLLSSDEITKFPEEDPSTGKYVLDENGNIVMSQIVSNNKFAESNQISIIDIE